MCTSARGHPRAKHLVYVVVAGSRATQCRKRGSKRIPSRRETAKNHEKRHAIVFFGAVSSRSGHRSVGHRKTCGRGRFKTLNRGTDTWDVSLCVVRVYSENAASELASGENRARGSRDLAGAFSATMVCIRGASRAVLRTTGSSNAWSASRRLRGLEISTVRRTIGRYRQ